MKTWHDTIQAEIATRALEREQRKLTREQENEERRRRRFSERFTPADEKIQRLLDAMPAEERHQPRDLMFFQKRIKAKYRAQVRGEGYGSPSELGQALRRLGWTPRRNWSGRNGPDGIKTLWYPPTADDEGKKAA